MWSWLTRENLFPPELIGWKFLLLLGQRAISLLAFFYVIDQAAVDYFPKSTHGTYIALILIPLCFLLSRVFQHEIRVHEERLQDPSEVEALIVEARTIEPRMDNKPENYAEKAKDLQEEADRLEKAGPYYWTEYQILSLNQMLVDFLKIHDLKERADSSLDDLEEYATDSAYSYDLRKFDRWKERIDKAEEELDKATGDSDEQDKAAESLRASLRTLQEHVANYEAFWANGTVVIRSLIISLAISIPVLLIVGILPFWFLEGNKVMTVFNWALLGSAGSLTAVLLALRDTDVVAVGHTEGQKVLWRTVIGGLLGLVAGTLIYSLITGGLLSGSMFPANVDDFARSSLPNKGRTIFWAFAGGFSFERVFEQTRRLFGQGTFP